VNPYILGILWSIGYYEPTEKVFILRHKDKYFLEKVKDYVGSDAAVRKQTNQGKYIIKLGQYCFDIDELRQYGWTERNSRDRPYPSINEHQDFIRGYFELHGRISKVRLRDRRRGRAQIQVQTRLRIYGNQTLAQAINEIISFELGIPERRLESTSTEHSKVLGYYRKSEIIDIFEWLYQDAGKWKNTELEKQYRLILYK
jgi:hypothetical protein